MPKAIKAKSPAKAKPPKRKAPAKLMPKRRPIRHLVNLSDN